MADEAKTYAISEIVGTSTKSTSEAIENAVKKASASLRNLDWFEVVEVRGAIQGNAVTQYQVTIKIGFRYDD